jgi:uncharacterized protein (DUF1330 family)
MAAYAIAGIEVTEPEAYAAYARGVPATLEPYGGRFVVRGGPLEVIEGQWPAARTVILGFPSVEQAKAWYESEAYQALRPIRHRHARTDFMVVVEGVTES